jgi:hypothetical protein
MKDQQQDPEADETPTQVDAILRALAYQDSEGSLPAPADERLRAYREGRLSPDEVREMEVLLAESAAGRRRLLELAGIDRSLPLRRVRKAVLGQAVRQRRVSPWLSVTGIGGMAAMAAMAAMVLLALAGILSRQRALPEGLAYEVSARGLAEVRSTEEVPDEVRAYPSTALHILLRPRGDSPAGLSFALFRREDGVLRRVQPPEARLESDRGSASFTGAAAGVLATDNPGVYLLYVVVSNREDLPARVELGPGQDPAGALRASGRLVYPVTITLLPAEEDVR